MLLLCKAIIFCDSLNVFLTHVHGQISPPPVPAQPPFLVHWTKGGNFFYEQKQQTETLCAVSSHTTDVFTGRDSLVFSRGDTLVNLNTDLWTAKLIQPIFLWLS